MFFFFFLFIWNTLSAHIKKKILINERNEHDDDDDDDALSFSSFWSSGPDRPGNLFISDVSDHWTEPIKQSRPEWPILRREKQTFFFWFYSKQLCPIFFVSSVSRDDDDDGKTCRNQLCVPNILFPITHTRRMNTHTALKEYISVENHSATSAAQAAPPPARALGSDDSCWFCVQNKTTRGGIFNPRWFIQYERLIPGEFRPSFDLTSPSPLLLFIIREQERLVKVFIRPQETTSFFSFYSGGFKESINRS